MEKCWKEQRLGDILTFQRGHDITKDVQSDGPYPVVSSSGISSCHNQFKVKGPGLVTGRKGTLGKVFYVENDFWPHDTTLWIKDFKGNDPRFLYYFLQILHFEQFDSGASNPTLNRNHVHSLKVIFPTELSTQRRIANILSAYDELIEVNNQRIRLLEDTARQLYREWFVRLRFPGWKGVRKVKGVPEGWGNNNVYSIADVKGGGTPSTKKDSYWNGNIPFYTPTDFSNQFFIHSTEKYITESGLMSSSTRLFPKNTTFITARGTVGNICMAGDEMAMNQSCFALISFEPSQSFFLFLFTLEMVDYLKKVATGATFDAITLETFRNYKRSIPPTWLRDQFSILITPIFQQIETLQQQNTQLCQIRDHLLPRLVSGKLPVEEVENNL